MYYVETHDDTTILHIRGDVDFAAKANFRELLASAAQKLGSVVVNLDECPYFDSTGLGELIRAHHALGKRLTIVLPPAGVVARIFAITGLDLVLNVKRVVPVTRSAEAT